jgi:hypothetical protein
MRDGLPDNLKHGFDKWIAEMRARVGDPEQVLGSKSPRAVESIAEGYLRRHTAEVAQADRRT